MNKIMRLLLYELWKLIRNRKMLATVTPPALRHPLLSKGKVREGSDLVLRKLSFLISLELLRIEIAAEDWQQLDTFMDELLNLLYARCRIVVGRLRTTLPRNLAKEDWQDGLQAAYAIVSSPDIFLNNFDVTHCTPGYIQATLIKFVDRKLKGTLIAQLRQITGQPTIGRTSLGLMARASAIQVRKVIQFSGYSGLISAQYLLAWQCFKEVQIALALSINQYKTEHYQIIADRYNQHHLYPEINAEQVKQRLEEIGSAIRQSIEPQCCSIDINNNEPSLEPPTYPTSDSNEVDIREFREHLKAILDTLTQEKKKLLLFRHGLNMKQEELAQAFGIKQSSIQRRLSNVYQETILPEIENWIRKNLDSDEYSPPDASEKLKQLKIILDDYHENQLNIFYQQFLEITHGASEQCLRYKIIILFEHYFDIETNQITRNKLLNWLREN